MHNDLEKHSVILKNRTDLRIEGVQEVVSFDELCVMLKTQFGDMTIEGNDLKISVLEIDAGIVVLTGTISGVYYSEQLSNHKRGFFRSLFS